MSILIGVFCGLIAMLGWGIGEFLMKEPSKRIGEIEIFFYMQFIGAIITIPIFINYIKNNTIIGADSTMPCLYPNRLQKCATGNTHAAWTRFFIAKKRNTQVSVIPCSKKYIGKKTATIDSAKFRTAILI
mgnify:CR=1 FL=1